MLVKPVTVKYDAVRVMLQANFRQCSGGKLVQQPALFGDQLGQAQQGLANARVIVIGDIGEKFMSQPVTAVIQTFVGGVGAWVQAVNGAVILRFRAPNIVEWPDQWKPYRRE